MAGGESRVRTQVHAIEPPLGKRIASVLVPNTGTPEELSPLRFQWALAEETVEERYGGQLTWRARAGDLHFVLDMPVTEN